MFILELLKLFGYMAIVWGLNQMLPPHSSDITHKNLYDSLVYERYQSRLDHLAEPQVISIDDSLSERTTLDSSAIEFTLTLPDSIH